MIENRLYPQDNIQRNTDLYIKDLRELQKYNPDIPEQLIHSFMENNEYKVRKGWFTGIVHITENICTNMLIDKKHESLRQELISYLNINFINNEFKDRLTTKDDIKKGDQMIEKLINILENIE